MKNSVANFNSSLDQRSYFLVSNGLLIDDVRFGARLFTQLCCSHVKTEGNKVAYEKAYLS